jgi:hypothetical protein
MAMQSSFSIEDGKHDDDGRIKRTGLYSYLIKTICTSVIQ